MSVAAAPVHLATVADLLRRLGSIAPERVRFQPTPGTATEANVIELHNRSNRLFELVDGVLVEKAMGFYESRVAAVLIGILEAFLHKNDLGIVLGADGFIRLAPGLVRIPDIAFISWNKFPGRKLPREPIPDLVPDLVVEVLSKSNTPQELKRKLREYFGAGVKVVWHVNAETRTVEVFNSPGKKAILCEDDELGGGRVMPGFKVSIRRLFARAGQQRDV
jgi:Uma2 family endonuclease